MFVTPRREPSANKSWSSNEWWRNCTKPGWKWFSTWPTITPGREISSDRFSPSKASTIEVIIACPKKTNAALSITPERATPSIAVCRTSCDWSWTVYATGFWTCMSMGSGEFLPSPGRKSFTSSRLQIWPGRDFSPRIARRGSSERILRHHPSRPGDRSRETARRALGSRRRRLSDRQVPSGVGGVERKVSRLRPRLLARSTADALGVRRAFHRQFRSLPRGSTRTDRIDQLSHCARRVHAQRSRLVQRETQSRQRRRKQRRRKLQSIVELRSRGTDGRREYQSASQLSKTQLSHHTLPLSGHSHAHRRSVQRSVALTLCEGELPLGDEFGRTQQGNNNAYCQDNEISWVNWLDADGDLLRFVQQLIHFRRQHPVFRRRRWFRGTPITPGEIEDIAWFTFDGEHMKEEDWQHDYAKSFGVFINGRGMRSRTTLGERVTDDSFYIIFNAYHGYIDYKLPGIEYAQDWSKILDTSDDRLSFQGDRGEVYQANERITVHDNSILLLHHVIPVHEHLAWENGLFLSLSGVFLFLQHWSSLSKFFSEVHWEDRTFDYRRWRYRRRACECPTSQVCCDWESPLWGFLWDSSFHCSFPHHRLNHREEWHSDDGRSIDSTGYRESHVRSCWKNESSSSGKPWVGLVPWIRGNSRRYVTFRDHGEIRESLSPWTFRWHRLESEAWLTVRCHWEAKELT